MNRSQAFDDDVPLQMKTKMQPDCPVQNTASPEQKIGFFRLEQDETKVWLAVMEACLKSVEPNLDDDSLAATIPYHMKAEEQRVFYVIRNEKDNWEQIKQEFAEKATEKFWEDVHRVFKDDFKDEEG